MATEALLAVLPAWLAAGRPAAEAAAAVVDAALGLPDHRQLAMLTALHAALPQVGAAGSIHIGSDVCLCHCILVLSPLVQPASSFMSLDVMSND